LITIQSSKIKTIKIPHSIINISNHINFYFKNLQSIIVDSNNTVYDSRDNCNAIIETKTNTLILGCNNTKIPNGIEIISNNAFAGNSIMEYIEIPSSVKTIEENAFLECTSLKTILFNENSQLQTIKKQVFAGCVSLDYISLPEGTEYIGEKAFEYCVSLETVDLPSTITEIGEKAFSSCALLLNIVISKNVTKMGDSVFIDCVLVTINCEASSKPSSWHTNWNPSKCIVNWGYQK